MEQEGKYNKKLLAFFIVFFIIIVFLAVYGAEHYDGHDESIELEQYCKISDSDLIKNSANTYIYYVAWNGSPTGNAGSWAIYQFLSENGCNMTRKFNTSQSMGNFEYNNTPGIIFNHSNYTVKYNGKTTVVVPVYLYGENLTNKTTISAGLKTLKSDAPASVYQEIKIYTTEAIVDGLSISSDNISAFHHINSVTLITGPSGVYILNGYLVNPSNFIYNNNPLPPETVLSDIKSKQSDFGVGTAVEGLESTIKDVN
ncbi:DUF929 family protein [Ferroplasma sp.]|uniref:DUF929 family protein n=1 Tax=Ferroplasma sp. TaxID=2591003 RepID=UPI00307DDE24